MLSAPPWRSVRGGATGQVRSHRFEVGDAQGFPVGCVAPLRAAPSSATRRRNALVVLLYFLTTLTEPRSRAAKQMAPQLPRPGSRGLGVSVRPRRSSTTESVGLSRSTRFPRIGFSRPSLQPGRTLWGFENDCSSHSSGRPTRVAPSCSSVPLPRRAIAGEHPTPSGELDRGLECTPTRAQSPSHQERKGCVL